MNSKYIDLFDTLVKAYYEGNFDDTLDTIMVCHEKSPQDTFNIITSLCGVDVKFDNNYKYVSIIPLTTNVTGITIEGMKYIINDYTLSIGDSLGVSNEQIDKEAKISIKTGILVVIKSKD